MKRTLLIMGILALGAGSAAAEGINLSWDDCGLFGSPVASFTCNTNTGTAFTMVGSFVAPSPGLPEFLGVSAQVDISSNTTTLPDWWRHGTGQCRGSAALATNFDFLTSSGNCVDPYVGQAAGGYLYEPGFGTLNRARLIIQGAVPLDIPQALDDVAQVYAFKVNINRTKSSGTGSCAGCTQPVCIVLNSIQAYQTTEQGFDPAISVPLDRNYVTWQTASVPGCPLSTPTKSSSWGLVKSLYR